MKKIIMITKPTCPHCRKALVLMDELITQNPEYKALEIEKIDASVYPAKAKEFEHEYVPAYYVDGKKAYEGATTPEIIKQVFDTAM